MSIAWLKMGVHKLQISRIVTLIFKKNIYIYIQKKNTVFDLHHFVRKVSVMRAKTRMALVLQ